MFLIKALSLTEFPSVISIIGAGGKTSTMKALAQELSLIKKKVLVTTTTHISQEQGSYFDKLIIEKDLNKAYEKIISNFKKVNTVCLVTQKTQGIKYKGIPTWWVENLRNKSKADVIIVEADGAKGRSFKVPNKNEPVLAKARDKLVLLLGIDALDQHITEKKIHRPELLLEMLGTDSKSYKDIQLTEENISKAIFHREGLLKRVDDWEDIYILINKVNQPMETRALSLGKTILNDSKSYGYSRLKVLIGQVQNQENPINYIVDK